MSRSLQEIITKYEILSPTDKIKGLKKELDEIKTKMKKL
jgi:hypothetical protein